MSRQSSTSRPPVNPDDELRRAMSRKTRRSFLIGGAATAATIGAYEWLSHAKQIGQLQSPLRRAEQFNAAVSRALFPEQPLAPTYPMSRSTELRLNADVGLDLHMVPDSWRLQVVGLAHPEKYKQYIEDVDLWSIAPPITHRMSHQLRSSPIQRSGPERAFTMRPFQRLHQWTLLESRALFSRSMICAHCLSRNRLLSSNASKAGAKSPASAARVSPIF